MLSKVDKKESSDLKKEMNKNGEYYHGNNKLID